MLLWEKHPEVTCLGSRQAKNLTSVGRGTEAWLGESQVKSPVQVFSAYQLPTVDFALEIQLPG